MNTFYINSDDKKIELTIKEIVSEHSCIIDASVNGKEIAKETKASISRCLSKPECLFLHFDSLENRDTMMCICDLSKEPREGYVENVGEIISKNREIADYIWWGIRKKINPKNPYAIMVHRFTSDHSCNWED